MIPEAAVEAGLYAWGFSSQNIDERRELLRHILEAAAPHMLAPRTYSLEEVAAEFGIDLDQLRKESNEGEK